jgi:lycopene cyclase domain-containing protein
VAAVRAAGPLMEYTLAAAMLLLVALVLTFARGAAGDGALWLGLLAFAVLTVFADSLLVRVGVFGYQARYRSGIDVLAIPVEDLLYGCALYLLAVAAWSWQGRR